MRSAIAVIGANYGDEGKGLVVDAVSDRPDTVVVRFNGGAQAGHTVVTPEGRRHVFHHHGAGTLRGAATYLSKHFILNPIMFEMEHRVLGHPLVMADPAARTTTPFDMMLNQWAEEDRGTARHGSCGMGINETVERCSRFHPSGVMTIPQFLDAIRYDYVPERAREIGVELTDIRRRLLDSPTIRNHYLSAHNMMQTTIKWREPAEIEGSLVFEGAQGLLLDEHGQDFPYVTRSKTGLHNVRELCDQMGVTDLHAIFVTRTYLTRHGAGPLPQENPRMAFRDDTNVPNPWQQTLRFAPLDVESFLYRVMLEAIKYNAARASVAMTCVDQLDNEELRAHCPSLYESHGPTRETFRKIPRLALL